jgi:2-desacetyl-2-hydroxyethyl bacteriochlorophyllide A dehydrogenase
MSTTTKAIVFAAAGAVELQRLPVPDPAAGEVQIRTACSAVSAGTEGWLLQDKVPTPVPFPIVPGYQRMGTIVAVGPEVDDWQVGDLVAATESRWDGAPAPFLGAHVGVANSPVAEVYRLPNGVDPIDAASAVVAQVGNNAASRVTLSPGDWVLVFGDGLIGQLAAQAARARGARVILAGHRAERLALAAEHSADHVLDDRDERFHEQVREAVGSDTVAAVIDTIQSEALQRHYVDLLERGRGQIVYAGFGPATVWADMLLLQGRELTTHNISGWTRPRMEAAIALLADGGMRVRPLITHRIKPDAAADAYDMILHKGEPHLGIVVDWSEAGT